MAKVFELTGNIGRNLVTDTTLVFPNVLTCVAVVAVSGARLVGAHVTQADASRLSEVGKKVKEVAGLASDIYVIGNILPRYNVNSFANFGGRVRIHNCPGSIDVRASLDGGSVKFEKKLISEPETDYQEIPTSQFQG